MTPMAQAQEIRLLIGIVDKGREQLVTHALASRGLSLGIGVPAQGTATSVMLDYFGLSRSPKEVVLCPMPAVQAARAMREIDETLGLSRPGNGILFTLALTGASGQMLQMLGRADVAAGEEKGMECERRYDLVVAVVDHGCVDVVMDAARQAGCRGGTVVRGRRLALEQGALLLGRAIEPENDIVGIVVASEARLEVMRAVNAAAGLASEAHGIVFSLPVTDIMGMPDEPSEQAGQA